MMHRALTLALTALLLAGCYQSASELADEAERQLKAYQLDEAEAGFLEALSREPTLPRALYGLGWIYLARGDMVRARMHFERCMEVDPNYYGCHRGMGSLHLSMGFVVQAEASYRRAVELRPEDAASVTSLGQFCLQTRRFEEAEQLFERAVALEPDRGEVYFGMAQLRFQQGQDEQALALLEKAASLPVVEVKFEQLIHEQRAQIYTRRSAGLLKGRGDTVDEQTRAQAIDLLDKALAEMKQAIEKAVLADKVRLERQRQKLEVRRTEVAASRSVP